MIFSAIKSMDMENNRAQLKKQKINIIVETAFNLFKKNGFYATGVDLIMREAGVSKRTLYKYFHTKNELIVAVLEYYQTSYQEHLDDLLAEVISATAREKILLIFDDANSWFDDINFHGCLAVNAMGEFSGKDQAIEIACINFKHWEIDVFSGLTKQLDVDKPIELAYKLFVILEGMSSIAQVTKGNCPVDMRIMAEQLIDSH